MRAFQLWALGLLMAAIPAHAQPAVPKGLEEFRKDAPALEFTDSGHRVHQLSEWRGHPILLHFWATWCGPCKQELPSLAKTARSQKGVVFLPIAVDAEASDAELSRFVSSIGEDVPVYRVKNEKDAHPYWAWGLPVTYVIGPDGKLRSRALGARAWASPAISNGLAEYLRGFAQNK